LLLCEETLPYLHKVQKAFQETCRRDQGLPKLIDEWQVIEKTANPQDIGME